MSDKDALLAAAVESRPVFGPEAFELDLAPILADGGLRVLLRSEVKDEWLGDAAAIQVSEDDGMTVVTRELGPAGQAAVASAMGAHLRLHGEGGRSCLAKITGAVAVGRLDTGGELDQSAGPAGVWQAAGETRVVAGNLETLEGDCTGALWARSEPLPRTKQVAVSAADAELRRAAIRALRARPEYRDLTDGSGAEEFQVATLSDGGETLVVTTFLAEGCTGMTPALVAVWERQAGGALRFLGAPGEITEILAAVDADGDGHLELLAREDLLGIAVLRRDERGFAVAERAPVNVLGCRC